jgi:hypothetical protein
MPYHVIMAHLSRSKCHANKAVDYASWLSGWTSKM